MGQCFPQSWPPLLSKLVMSIPFTPVEGNRIYADDDDKAIEALEV